MEKTGVHVISKNVNYRRDRFKCLKIVEKDQAIVFLRSNQIKNFIDFLLENK